MRDLYKTIWIFLFLAALSLPALGDVYQWTDDQGIRHFSNVSPPPNRDSVRASELSLPHGFSCLVVKIYDGDTIRVKGNELAFKVRLAGIDCPESPWKTMPEQPYAKQAKETLTGLILNKKVILRQHGIGSYNRVLAEVFFKGQNINLRMVRMGLAEVYQGKLPPSLNRREFLQTQTEAKRKKTGIWSMGETYVSPREWRNRYLNPR